MEHLFKLTPEQKQLIQTFTPYLDYEEPGFEARVTDMITVLDWGDQFSQWIIEFAILGRGVQDFEKTLEVARQLVEHGLNFKPPRFWTGNVLWNLWQSPAHLDNPDHHKYMQLMEQVTTAVQEDPTLWLEHTRRDRPIAVSTDTRAANIGNHMGAYYVFTRRVDIPDVIHHHLERAIQARDDEYIAAYIQEFVAIFEIGYRQIAIAGIKPVANYKNEEIQKTLIDFLVRARNYDPEYMEDLLLRGEFPQEITDRVLANPTSERLADLLTYQLITIIYDLFILGPKTLRNELKWLLSTAVELSNLQDFFSLTIREIFNLVLGEVVFSVPKDAPSRQMSMKEPQ
jgi:hypothetical protein